MTRITSIVPALLLALCLTACGPSHRPAGLQHFIDFGLQRDRISDPRFLDSPGIAGAQLKYTWRELEPERDRYVFDAVRHDLELLSSRGKGLFIQLQDVSFMPQIVNVPDYLLEDPAFHSGAAMQYGFEDDDESRPVAEGWVSRRWEPAVRERLGQLLLAMADEFDGRVAGLNLPETSVGFGGSGNLWPDGYSPAAYFEGLKAIITEARQAFRRSDVIIYANFMPGEELPRVDHGYLKGIYEHAARQGVGVGGPDILPFRWLQRQNSLPLIAGRPPGIVAGMAVQRGNLEDVNPATGKPVTVQELTAIARDELRLDYIFWGTQEPFFSEDILPYLQALD